MTLALLGFGKELITPDFKVDNRPKLLISSECRNFAYHIFVSPQKHNAKWKLLDLTFFTNRSSMYRFIDSIRCNTLFGIFNATNTRWYVSESLNNLLFFIEIYKFGYHLHLSTLLLAVLHYQKISFVVLPPANLNL